MEESKICICGQHGSYRCSQCKIKYYCSVTCQKEDWNLHKKECMISKNDINKVDITFSDGFAKTARNGLLTSNFYQLSNDDKNGSLDIKMKLLCEDLINEEEACMLFEQLDMMERYSDTLRLLIQHPRLIHNHFEATSNIFHYNIEHKWDWNLQYLTFLTPDQWKLDLIYTIDLINNTKLSKIIQSKLFEDKSIKKEYKKIKKRLFN